MHVRKSVVVRRNEEDGASLVEYGLMLALIAVVAFSAVSFFGASGDGLMSKNCQKISAAMSTGECKPTP